MPSARVFPSLAADADLFARLDRMRTQHAVAQTQVTPDLAAHASALAAAYPQLDASVVIRLAQGGVAPDDPRMQQISVAGAKKKAKSGFGWHSFGDVVKAAGRLGDTALGGVDEALSPILKGVTRTAAIAAQSGYEEAQGLVRDVASVSPEAAGAAVGGALGTLVPGVGNVVGAAVGGAAGGFLGHLAADKVQGHARWEPQSSGSIALGRLMNGEKVDLGSGWLPNTRADSNPADSNPSIGAEQVQRARRVTIGGHALTPGRLLASGVVQPGTKPYNLLSGLVDASLAMSRYDPAAATLKTGGNVVRNRELFTSAGGLLAHRPTILPEVADKWWSGATDLRQALVADSDFYSVWTRTGRKLDVRTAAAVADATTPAEVDNIVRPLLGVDVRGRFGYKTFSPYSNVRLFKGMPGRVVDLRDPEQAVGEVEKWLQNAKASKAVVADFTGRMARADSRFGRLDVLTEVMDATKHLLTTAGVADAQATTMTHMIESSTEDTRKYFVRATASGGGVENVNVPGMWIGKAVDAAHPHLYAEFLNRSMELPDPREIRRTISVFEPILNNPAIKVGVSTLDHIQSQYWKKMALLRGAYTARVVGEEQARMAASGLDSMVNHPMSLIAWRMGQSDSRIARVAAKVGLSKGATDIAGHAFQYKDAAAFADGLDEFNKALNREWAGWADNTRVLGVPRAVHKGEADFHRWWADELLTMGSDPIMREVARNGTALDTVKQSFWDGALHDYRTNMAQDAHGLVDRATSDAYIDSLAERLSYKTGNHPELIDMVGSGKIGGVAARKGMSASPEMKAWLAANESIAPDIVKGQLTLAERGVGHYWDQATQWMFSNLMGERTNNLSRSPTFKQNYWNRVEELAGFMDPAAHAQVVGAARAANLADVADRISAIRPRGALNLEHADTVAKGYALDQTKKLLYDMTEKGQFFDAARMIFPFGEAWKEMGTRWLVGKDAIVLNHPEAFRRGAQIITGGRENGFFHKNDRGEEVFNYPATGWVSDKLIGVPVPLTGRVAGLSLMTDVMPGVGPVVQIPAGAFIPDAPEWDWMRKLMFPFGETDTSHGLVEGLMPAWAHKWMQASGVARNTAQFNSAVMDTARYLASTGKYPTDTVDGINKLIGDAKEKARYVYALRGAAQFFAPTAPNPEWMVKDKTGQALVAQTLVSEYHDLLTKDPQTATQAMLDKYGPNLFLLLQGKTAEVTPNAPISQIGAQWERSHAAVVKSHPDVFGFFAPDDGTLDSAAFDRQKAAGRRVDLTPDQAVRLANNRIGNALFQQAKSKVGDRPNAAGRQWLRGFKDVLIQRYPGYGEHVGVPEKASTDSLVRGLQSAVADERLAGNPNTKPISIYLQARDKAIAAATGAGLAPSAFATSRSMAGVRTWLRGLADVLIKEHPSFGDVWDRVFDRELTDDTVQQEVPAA